MAQVSPFLRRMQGGYGHYCPGCDEIHRICVGAATGPNWAFNGDVNKPTFHPSVRISDGEGTLCHYFIVDGVIQFCGDSAHDLKGQNVPLPELPMPRYSDDQYGWPE